MGKIRKYRRKTAHKTRGGTTRSRVLIPEQRETTVTAPCLRWPFMSKERRPNSFSLPGDYSGETRRRQDIRMRKFSTSRSRVNFKSFTLQKSIMTNPNFQPCSVIHSTNAITDQLGFNHHTTENRLLLPYHIFSALPKSSCSEISYNTSASFLTIWRTQFIPFPPA